MHPVDELDELTVRQGASRTLEVSDHASDLDGVTVYVWLISPTEDVQAVGHGPGANIGTAFTLEAVFDVEPGAYRLEVGPNAGPIASPQDGRRPLVHVVDSTFD